MVKKKNIATAKLAKLRGWRLVINKKFLFLLLSVFASVFSAFVLFLQMQQRNLMTCGWAKRYHHGEEQDLILNVELSARNMFTYSLKLPGQVLDEQDEEFREPVLFGVFGQAIMSGAG